MPLIPTLAGQAAFAAAAAPGGEPVAFSKLVVGDGSGSAITPLETATELARQVFEVGIQSVSVDPNNANQLNIVALIPNEAGPFTMREVGLESADGTLLAISDYPETDKSVASQGVPTSIEVTLGLIVSDTSNVTIELADPMTVSTDRRIDTDDGVEGGGDFSQNRTFRLKFGSLTSITGDNVDNAVDKFAVFDSSANKHKKISPAETAKALGVQSKIDASIDAAKTNIVDVTDDYAAKAQDEIWCDTSTQSITITLPTDPANGDQISIIREGENNVLIERSGEMIGGVGDDFLLDIDQRGLRLLFKTDNWKPTTIIAGNI